MHVEIGTRQATANRIFQLCDEHHITPNGLANLSGVPQSTINSILNGKSRHPGAITIKKLCDGLGITLGEFFNTPEFDNLEQEIKLVCRPAGPDGFIISFFPYLRKRVYAIA